jgi:hypothetical protein
MAKITKVPNGPLIKKKGPYAGSTLRSGGTIKKAQNGDTLTVKKPMTYAEKRAAQEIVKEKNRKLRDSILNRNAAARGMTREEVRAQQEKDKKKPDACVDGLRGVGKDNEGCSGSQRASEKRVEKEFRRRNGGPIKKAQGGEYITQEEQTWNGKKIPAYTATKKVKTNNGPRYYQGNSPDLDVSRRIASSKERTNPSDSIPKAKLSKRALEVMNQKNGGKVKKAKAGAMIKRADGSMSKRGLWDNIRANKGSGKKPTKQMLVQEKKIKAKAKK